MLAHHNRIARLAACIVFSTLSLLSLSSISRADTSTGFGSSNTPAAPPLAPVVQNQTALAPNDFTTAVAAQSQAVQTGIASQLNSLFSGGANPTAITGSTAATSSDTTP